MPAVFPLQRLTEMSSWVEATHDGIIFTFEVVKLLTREKRRRHFIVEQIFKKTDVFLVCVREMIQNQCNFRGYSL